MFNWFKKWRYKHIEKRSLITDAQWNESFQCIPVLQRLNTAEQIKLKKLAILFLHYKSLETIGDLEITTFMESIIALQACLPIMNLSLDWYNGWVSVIIYPGAFAKQSIETDEYGIVHKGRTNLSGESWQKGPVILSWDDAFHQGRNDGRNVVIHEFAHKLDMLNGRANGLPPLHGGLSVRQWSDVFNHAYADFSTRLEQNDPIPIDPYAAQSPAEFFAVFSELFFEKPIVIQQYYSDVYGLLVKFYRQNPLKHSLPTNANLT